MVTNYSPDEIARILGHDDASRARNEMLSKKANTLDKQVSFELKQDSKTVADLTDYNNKMDKAFKDLTKAFAMKELQK